MNKIITHNDKIASVLQAHPRLTEKLIDRYSCKFIRLRNALLLSTIEKSATISDAAYILEEDSDEFLDFLKTANGMTLELETPRHKVLVVEDDPQLQNTLGIMLRKNDFECRSASDGEEGFQLCMTWRPDLIVTDVNMPKLNGLDLAAAIRNKDAEIKILFMTACFKNPELEERYRNEFARTPNCKLLLKPFDYNILLQLLRFMLDD